jgi:hypothetical protein
MIRNAMKRLFLYLVIVSAVLLLCAANAAAQCNSGGCSGCPASEVCYCGLEWELGYCYCVPGTPILIDLSGHGFQLTNPAEGVQFDFFQNGPVQISWTTSAADEGWLVLPPNGNGSITNGTEMFGNLTPQPPSDDPNGFRALAVYDDPKNGGNGDGIIDSHDAIFSRLRIWRDSNHNGISESSELISLQDAGIRSISLDYTETGYVDKWGNRFRYRARIVSSNAAEKWAYDVILQFNQANMAGNVVTNSGKRTARAGTLESIWKMVVAVTETRSPLRFHSQSQDSGQRDDSLYGGYGSAIENFLNLVSIVQISVTHAQQFAI